MRQPRSPPALVFYDLLRRLRKEVRDETTTQVLRHIGANVQALRVGRGLSPAELAEQVDREPSYMQKIEYGTAVPSIHTLVRIALALDVEIDKLFRPRKAPARRIGRPRSR